MVGVVRNELGEVVTLHRTFLRVGGLGKADIESPKRLMPTLGGWLGGAVRLSHVEGLPELGPVGSPGVALPALGLSGSRGSPALPALVVGEGIESSLAAGVALGEAAWACLTAGGLEAFRVPVGLEVGEVIVAGDSDASGVGQAAAHALAARLWREGYAARVLLAPDGFGDWMDFVAANQ
jgi:putative DNA primase/helicase